MTDSAQEKPGSGDAQERDKYLIEAMNRMLSQLLEEREKAERKATETAGPRAPGDDKRGRALCPTEGPGRSRDRATGYRPHDPRHRIHRLYRRAIAGPHFLNYRLPCSTLGELPSLVAHPEALQPRRLYRPEWEEELWTCRRSTPISSRDSGFDKSVRLALFPWDDRLMAWEWRGGVSRWTSPSTQKTST